MWPLFKLHKVLRPAIFIIAMASSLSINGQQLVRDLAQDWLEYNVDERGFLPVDEQKLETGIINFSLATQELDPFYLVIGVREEATLFYKDELLATLHPGYTSFRIDSLKSALHDNQPFLAIYGKQLLPYLKTAVYTQPIRSPKMEIYEPVRFANAFSNFVYTSSTIILLFFVLLKVRLPEITEQYLLVQRSLRLKTIDELIYKIAYLKLPNIWFLVFIASLYGFATSIFMYFYPNELLFFGWNPLSFNYGSLLVFWFLVTFVIFIGIVLKYLLTAIIAALFGLNITNVHYASSLRLILLLGLVLASLGFGQFVLQINVNEMVYWIILILSLVIIEVILFFKLTLVTSHTLLYIIVYLCATEIIPVVFLFKLYTA
jgi:hypothetical protein